MSLFFPFHSFRQTYEMSQSTIDDADARITYSNFAPDDWERHSSDRARWGTVTRTWNRGATATISFKGTSIQVFGTLNQGIHFFCSIDNEPLEEFYQFLDTKVFQQNLYTSPDLNDGDHTLVITQGTDKFPLILDYIIINSPSAMKSTTIDVITQSQTVTTTQSPERKGAITTSTQNVQAPRSSTTSSRNATSSSTSATHTMTLSPSLSSVEVIPSTSSSQSSSNTIVPSDIPISASSRSALSTGSIIGLAVGLTVFLGTAIVLACLWYRRRRRQKLLRPSPLPHDHTPSHVLFSQSGPNSPTSGFPPLPTSEKAQLKAFLEAQQDFRPRGEISPRFDEFSVGHTSTAYTSQLSLPDLVLAPLRFSATPIVSDSEMDNIPGTSNTAAGPSNQVVYTNNSNNNNNNRNSLNNDRSGTPTTRSNTFAEPPTATTTSSVVAGFPSTFITQSLHFRNVSLGMSDRARAGARSVASTTRGADSDFDELPPYPGSARWSRQR